MPGGGSQACDPNSQNRPPFSLYQFIYLFMYYFPSQNFQVGGLAIIHKRNEPNLARGCGDLQELILYKYGNFFVFNIWRLFSPFFSQKSPIFYTG